MNAEGIILSLRKTIIQFGSSLLEVVIIFDKDNSLRMRSSFADSGRADFRALKRKIYSLYTEKKAIFAKKNLWVSLLMWNKNPCSTPSIISSSVRMRIS